MIHYQLNLEINICKRLYGFLPFATNMGKNIVKNLSKNLSGKYSQNLLIMLNNPLKMHLKLLQKE